MVDDIEGLVRTRLRGLRVAAGLSLAEAAERAHLSPSTLSRIETGKRTIGLDVLGPLCEALQTDLATLLGADDEEAVVIRPEPVEVHGQVHWPLTRNPGTAGLTAARVRIEPRRRGRDLGVHPGRDWFYVLSGRVQLTLGERVLHVEAGEAAEFSTMTPHRFDAIGGPAEVITIFDRDGQRAHLSGSPT